MIPISVNHFSTCSNLPLFGFISIVLLLTLMVVHLHRSRLAKNKSYLLKLSHSVFENINSALILINAEKKITLINSSAYALFNKDSSEDLINQSWESLLSPVLEPVFDKIAVSIEEDENFSRNYRVFLPDGVLYLQCSLYVLDIPEENPFYLLSFTDKTAEDEVRQKLASQLEETQRYIASKENFFSNMSHEIRTPINAIVGLTFVAKKYCETEKNLVYLEKIEHATEQLLNVANDILDFSKMKETTFELLNEAFNLKKIKNILVDLFKMDALKKQIDLSINFDCPDDLIIYGDQFRLTQIFMNIISNALKFTQNGSITVSLGYELLKNDIILRCHIKDTGIGISEENLVSLFTDYEQFGQVLEKKFEGTGLGLAITKRLVELMNGVIWVESTPGKGSIFYFVVVLKNKKEEA